MPRITKPLKGPAFVKEKAKYPYLATPKIDGIRFLMVDGDAVSASFKPIRNHHVRRILRECLPDGIDGELTTGDNFSSSSSAIMNFDGEPEFTIWIFDYVDPATKEIAPYDERMAQLREMKLEDKLAEAAKFKGFHVRSLSAPVTVNNKMELDELNDTWCDMGYEGTMLRDPKGTYKMGKSSVKQNIIFKVKKFVDAEAEIIGFEEKLHNANEAEKDAFGRTKRSKALEGLIPTGTLGALVVRTQEGIVFKVGSGFDDDERQEIWDNKDDYLGKLVKYKSMEHGVKEKPRLPVYLGIRHPDDLS